MSMKDVLNRLNVCLKKRDYQPITITDEHGWVRMDDLELRDDIQDEVKKRWEEINTDNVSELADVDGYWEDFYRMFGFKEEGIDYEAETDPVVEIPSIKE